MKTRNLFPCLAEALMRSRACLGVASLGSRVLPALIAVLSLLPAGRVTAQTFTILHSSTALSVRVKAGTESQGNGMALSRTAEGARLRCSFQRIEGEATREGLWLTSSVIPPSGTANDRFRIVAAAVGRVTACAPAVGASVPAAQLVSTLATPTENGAHAVTRPTMPLLNHGNVSLDGQVARFSRPGLVEEYSVSMDGVRQDFVVLERPEGAGELAVALMVSGARVEPAAGGACPVRCSDPMERAEHGSMAPHGAQLVLENSGRKVAYGRLRATDAAGKELTARIEVLKSNSESGKQEAEMGETSAPTLLVVVNDAEAVYPVRIDPTFSDANWISMGGIPGADNTVLAAVVDGSGNLYIGGYFTVVGDVIANHIAKWDGSRWSALGSGVNNAVQALAVSGSNVYAAGSFTLAGGIAATNVAKWDGSSWSALGSGLDGSVYALAVSGSDLYAGGNFTMAGGIAAANIAKWDGSSWSALGLGLGGSYPYVKALAVSGSDLYAGGYFTTAGGVSAANIAKWDGNGWSAMGPGMTTVQALAVSGSAVYAASDPPGGMTPPGYVLKWDGNNWSTPGIVDGNFSGGYLLPVYALAVSGNGVYAGGYFTEVDAGGYFTEVNRVSASDIAKWDGSSWSALGSGMDGIFPYDRPNVSSLAVSGTNVYAGGYFAVAGDAGPSQHIARWNGSGWSALGAGIPLSYFNIPVNTLALADGDLYVGGKFTEAGGIAATNIAKWNGSNWSALGSGIGGSYPIVVDALATSGSNVYAGGSFTTAGGIAATNIAKWDGNSWSALGSGIASVSASVNALAVSGSNLYAGGSFTTAGGIAATNIAKWDGSSWSALGSGIGSVSALALSGSNLYVAGHQFIAKWDGSSWSALGSGMGGGSVSALVVSGGNLYAGGNFTMAGGIAATNIAKWDGTNWSALASGIGGGYPAVHALAASDSDLYAGGTFLMAGGKVSANVARAIVNPPVLAIVPDGFGGYFLRFSAVPGSGYRLQRAPVLSGPWATSSPQTAPASGFLEFWDVFPLPGQGFYRSVQP